MSNNGRPGPRRKQSNHCTVILVLCCRSGGRPRPSSRASTLLRIPRRRLGSRGSVRSASFVLMDAQGPEGFEELLAFLPGGDRLRGEFHEPVVDGVTGEITEFRSGRTDLPSRG